MTLLSVKDVADYLKLSERTVYKLVREGRLPAARIGGVYRFRREEIDEWMRATDSEAGRGDEGVLARLKKEPDQLKKRLLFMGLVNKRLGDQPEKPVIVGGAAVDFYTAGGYSTADIDVVFPSEPLEAVMKEFGFKKEGRHWFDEDLGIALEAPSSFLDAEAKKRVVEVKIDGLSVFLLGVEDLIIDRLNAFVHWQSTDDGNWAKELIAIHSEELDWPSLSTAARKNKVDQALAIMAKELGLKDETS